MDKSFIKKDKDAKRAVYIAVSASVRSGADLALHRNEQWNFFYGHFSSKNITFICMAGVERFHWIEVAEFCVFLLQFHCVLEGEFLHQFHCVLEGEFLLKLFFSLTCSFFSSEFCEAHLQLLFTILEKAPQATIRANTIVAVGDLTFRFPNLIEPWTSHLYARFVNGELQTYKVVKRVLGRV